MITKKTYGVINKIVIRMDRQTGEHERTTTQNTKQMKTKNHF